LVDDVTQGLINGWRRWVDELQVHGLDEVEYEAMLVGRDELAERLAITGDLAAMDETESIDDDFRHLTVDFDHDRFSSVAGSTWWWKRLPADKEARNYFFGIY
jgi:hypothetical protein